MTNARHGNLGQQAVWAMASGLPHPLSCRQGQGEREGTDSVGQHMLTQSPPRAGCQLGSESGCGGAGGQALDWESLGSGVSPGSAADQLCGLRPALQPLYISASLSGNCPPSRATEWSGWMDSFQTTRR